jgi:hypothetical protein
MKMRPHRYFVSEIGSEQGQEGCIPFHIHILVRIRMWEMWNGTDGTGRYRYQNKIEYFPSATTSVIERITGSWNKIETLVYRNF